MKNIPIANIAKIERYMLTALIIVYMVGVALHFVEQFKAFAISITEYFLLIVNVCLIIYIKIKTRNKSLLFAALLIFSSTLLIEILGVKTGLLFGVYHYTAMWKITLFKVPVIIGINWLVYLLVSSSMTRWLTNTTNKWLRALCTGFLILGLDIFLEQVAIKLNYWQWEGESVPLQNYAMWFLIGFMVELVFSMLQINIKARLLNAYYMINLAFFILLLLPV